MDYALDGDAPKQFIQAYFFEENSGVRKANPKTWHKYIAKTAEKWYPHESVIEYMLNRIGETMGLKMNEIKLVRANGQIRFLSKYFLNKNEKLVHGAEICGEHIGDMDMAETIAKDRDTARELFTFEFIKEAIQSIFPDSCESLLCELVKMVSFDAIVGNNDRHFYNWGIIDTKKRIKRTLQFAPLYDTARGLLWNLSDENIVKYLELHEAGGKRVKNYVDNAYPRISIEENVEANHFDLIKFVKRHNNQYKQIVESLASIHNEAIVLEMLKKEFYRFFIPERNKLIEVILKNRFKTIREL